MLAAATAPLCFISLVARAWGEAEAYVITRGGDLAVALDQQLLRRAVSGAKGPGGAGTRTASVSSFSTRSARFAGKMYFVPKLL